ncbi:MAG: hypothetical protein H6R06_2319 [Proteobacteria bacterium]|jgi:hypothetical protein|nr:hypothetical protein [Pseudomonadota bacterium]
MTTPTDPTDEQIEQWLRASRTLEDAPDWLVERVIAQGASTLAAAAPQPTLGEALRRVLARLVSDTGAVPTLALGLRSAGPGTRQLLYAAEGRDIDVRITPASPAGGGWVISGQVLGPAFHGEVRLAGEGIDERAPLDDSAEFRFGPVPAGRWQLMLVGHGLQVELPALDIAAA